jgi:hypothetical protein
MPEVLAAEAPPEPAAPAGGFVVRRLNPLEDPQWDVDLTSCPGATFFHTSAWARVLRSAYGYKPVYFTVYDSGRLHSLLPMMEVDSWITGRRGVSLPFTDECAPLAPDLAAFRRLHGEALEYAHHRRWKYMEWRGGRERFGDAPASSSFWGHRLDLTQGEASIFSRCESAVRRAVRKAEQNGLTIEFSRDLAAVQEFHGLLRQTRKRHGVPPQPFHFFADIHRHVLAQNQGWVVLARHQGVPVAGAVYFHFGSSVVYKYGASNEAGQQLRANNLVMWQAIKRYAEDGFATFNFGRTATDNEGLRRFKLSWGATEHPIDYVRQDLRTGQFLPAQRSEKRWQTRLFQILPDPALRMIGAAFYKHVA